MTESVLDVRRLQVQFTTETEPVVAVKDLSFQLRRGEKLGIVGESGSGKSVTSLAIMGLVPTPGRVTEGEIYFTPEDLGELIDTLVIVVHAELVEPAF